VYLGSESAPGGLAWTDFVRNTTRVGEADLAHREARLQFDDPANIQYTSARQDRQRAPRFPITTS
jgi:hypothetical protein